MMKVWKSRNVILKMVAILVVLYVSVLVGPEVKAEEGPGTNSFWSVEDINPDTNPATDNWLTKLVVKATGVSSYTQLTQANFDGVTSLTFSGTSIPDTSWEAPKELANLRNLNTLKITGISNEEEFDNAPKELFEIPSLKNLTISTTVVDFPEKIYLATGIETLRFEGGTIGSDAGGQVSEKIKNLKNLKTIEFLSVNNLTFPAEFGELTELVNFQGIGSVNLPDAINNLTKLEKLVITGETDKVPEGIVDCTNLKRLELNIKGVEKIPDIGQLVNLETLSLSELSSKISIPDSLGNLKKLKVLNLIGAYDYPAITDGIVKLPSTIGGCEVLEELRISTPNMNSLPDSLTKIQTLNTLELRNCTNLESLPEQLGDLTNLTTLRLDNELPNRGSLTYLPDSITKLTKIGELRIENQQIKKLPEQLGEMSGLTEIRADGNQLEYLPESIGMLSSLRKLYVRINNLKEIPKAIGQLKLSELHLSGNQLTSLPAEIANLRGNSRVNINLSYNQFQQLPDLTLFANNTVGNLILDNCQITELGEWKNADNSPGILNTFYTKQGSGQTGVSLKGNHISGLPRSFTGVTVPQITELDKQTVNAEAKYDSNTKDATLLNPIWSSNEIVKLPASAFKISDGGVYDFESRTFSWKNATKGDVFTITFDGSSLYNSKTSKLHDFKGTIYVTIGEGNGKNLVQIKAVDEKGKEITNLWPEDFTTQYHLFPGEIRTFKLPNMDGYVLTSADGYDDDPNYSGSAISPVDGLIFLHDIKGDKEITFKYKAKKHEININVVEADSQEDLSALLVDPEFKLSYEVNEDENTLVVAPEIMGYKIKGESAKTINRVVASQNVTFEYIKEEDVQNLDSQINIKLVDASNGNELNDQVEGFQSIVTVIKNASYSITIPTINGYKVSAGQGSTMEVEPNQTAGDTYTAYIYYDRTSYDVNVVVKDEDGKDISTSIPVSYAKKWKANEGDSFVVTAPEITGYELTSTNNTVEITDIKGNQDIEFTYKRKTYKVTIIPIDAKMRNLSYLTDPLYQKERTVAYGDTIAIVVPPLTDSSYTLNEYEGAIKFPRITGDTNITFSFDSSNAVISVRAFTDSLDDLTSLIPIDKKYVSVPLNQQVNIDAPDLKKDGYVLADGEEAKKTILNVMDDQEIKFRYKVREYNVKIEATDEEGNSLETLMDAEDRKGNMVKHGEGTTLQIPRIPEYYPIHEEDSIILENVTADEAIPIKYSKKCVVFVNHVDSTTKKLLNDKLPADYQRIFFVEHDQSFQYKAPEIEGYKIESGDIYVQYMNDNRIFTIDYAEKDTPVTIHAVSEVDGADVDISNLIANTYKTTRMALVGETLDVEAPVIEGYTLVGDAIQNVVVEGPTDISFRYNKIEHPHTVSIVVKETDDSGQLLTNLIPEGYKTSYIVDHDGSINITAPILKDYQLKSESPITLSGVKQDETVQFFYEKIIKYTITVKAYDENDVDISSNIPQADRIETVIKGANITIYAPVFEGYTLESAGTQTVTNAQADGEVIFHYKKIPLPPTTYTITVKAMDVDIPGAAGDISTEIKGERSYPIEKGATMTIYAPVLEGYTLESAGEQTVTDVQADGEVTFTYKKIPSPPTTYTIKVKAIDVDIPGAAGDISDKIQVGKDSYTVTKGENIDIDAPILENYTLVSADKQTLTDVQADGEVIFSYKKITYTITVKAMDVEVPGAAGDISTEIKEERSYTVEKGGNVTIKAPLLENYTLESADEQTVTNVQADGEVTFSYKKITYTITVKAIDVEVPGAAGDISTSIEGERSYTVKKGAEITIPAPVLKNYTLESADEQTVTNVQADGEVTFSYKKITYTIMVKAIDVDVPGSAGDISSNITEKRSYTVIKGGNVTIKAPLLENYTLESADEQTVTNVQADGEVTFSYKKTPPTMCTITVKAMDVDVPGAAGDISTLIEGERSYTLEKGATMTINAPELKGYTLVSEGEQTVTNVQADGEVTFSYKKITYTITVKAMDVDVPGSAGDISTLIEGERSYTLEEGATMTINAPELKGYTLVSADEQTVTNVQADGEVTFSYKKITYTITVKAIDVDIPGAAGDISASIEGKRTYTLAKGATQTIQAPELEGYTLVSEGTQTVTDVQADGEVTFSYKKITYTITVKAMDVDVPGAAGDISNKIPAEEKRSYTLAKGATQTIQAPKLEGYTLVSAGEQTVTDVQADGEVTFSYKKITYTITVKAIDVDVPGAAGDISNKIPAEEKRSYTLAKGATQTIQAPELEGYTLVSSGEQTVTDVQADGEVTFNYKKITYTITVKAVDVDVPGAAGDISNKIPAEEKRSYTLAKGATQTIQAPELEGYTLVSAGEQTVTDVQADGEVTFSYKKITYTITVKAIDVDVPGAAGDISTDIPVAERTFTVEKGKDITISAPVLANYTLVGEGTQSLTSVQADREVTFSYKKITYTITVKAMDVDVPGATGDISDKILAEKRIFTVEKGAEITIEAPVLEGYTLVSEGTQSLTNVQADREVTFSYKKTPPTMYTITVKAIDVDVPGAAGDISASITGERTFTVEKGKDITISAPVLANYTLVGEGTQSLTSVQANGEVTFRYKKITYTITVKAIDVDIQGAAGDISASIEGKRSYTLEKGATQTIQAPVVTGYTLESAGEQTVTDVQADGEVTFSYKKIPLPPTTYTITVKAIDVDIPGAAGDISTEIPAEKRSYTLEKGATQIITAPELTGYTLESAGTQTVTNVQADGEVIFSYKKEIPVSTKVTVTIKVEDEAGNDLTSKIAQGTNLTYEVERNTNHIVNAPVINGYSVVGLDNKEFSPIQNNETVTFTYKMEPGQNPKLEIKGSEMELMAGKEFDLSTFILEASDSLNVDLANNVSYSSDIQTLLSGSIFKCNDVGTYTIVYRLAHPAGDVTKTLVIKVIPCPIPILELTTNRILMKLGEEINLKNYIKRAIDTEDGSDIKENVVCSNGRKKSVGLEIFKPTEEGIYEVTYLVAGQSGGIASETIEIEVVAEVGPVDPVDPVEPVNPVEPVSPAKPGDVNKTQNTQPKTGDNESAGVFALLLALATIGGCMTWKKK